MAESNLVNRIVWMDVPVVDLTRARDFYAGVLAIPVTIEKFEQVEFALLDHEKGNGGCLIIDPDNVGIQGPLVYMNVNGRLADAVQQVNSLGGEVLQDIHDIGPHGQRAIILDSEGNRLALHSEVV